MLNLKLLLFIELICVCIALPVIEKKDPEQTENEINQSKGEEWELELEYGRYLKEVVQALESDPEFRKKLESANVEDIKSGKIARELHLVDHRVRTKLDELKRGELERLRHLAMKEHEKRTGVDRTRLKIPVHVDHRNPARFESEDLRRLILQLNKDLEKVDKERADEFKRYEMEKEYEYKHKLDDLDEDQKQKLIMEHEEQDKKHKDHPKLHHPGSKQQLEEVWEEQDHMNAEDFDPKTFFHLHDLDGNGFWDENEVKVLFQKELDKMYDPNNPEDDPNERYEEMERMRTHVFGETDLDKDNLISFEEFIEQTKKNDFERDEGWQGLDEQEVYSQQEYEEFERQRQQELKRLVESGAIPPPPGYHGMNPPRPLNMGGDHHAGNGIPPVPVGVVGNAPHLGSQGYQQVPQGYQQVHPEMHQQIPQGYQQVPQGYPQVPVGYQQVPQGYQQLPQGYQQLPQGYQQVPQGYQQVPQGYQHIPPVYQVPPPQGNAQSHEQVSPQRSAPQTPQRSAAPQAPQPQAVLPAQPVPQSISQAQAVPQPIPQVQVVPQAIPQTQDVPKGRAPVRKVPDNQPPGIVLQNQQDNLNHQPEMKPLENNQIT